MAAPGRTATQQAERPKSLDCGRRENPIVRLPERFLQAPSQGLETCGLLASPTRPGAAQRGDLCDAQMEKALRLRTWPPRAD